jgi:parallel beta-helix repeat protein
MRTPLLLTIASVFALSAAAGPLEPPAGPIAPTNRTLKEVEPRTPISSTNTPGNSLSVYRITQPGSYYLTGNISGASDKYTILIQSPHVTLDLNGFTVAGAPSGRACIGTDGGRSGLTIRNGTIYQGASNGIELGSASSGSHLIDLVLENCSETSLYTGPAAVVERCVVVNADTQGIIVGPGSVVRDCAVYGSGDTAFSGTSTVFENCSAQNAAAYGFYAYAGCTLRNCSATLGGIGFYAEARTKFISCTATTCISSGFVTTSDVTVENCTASSCGVFGFSVGDRSIVRECLASGNALDGIVLTSKCIALGNSASDNGPLAGNTAAGIRIGGTDCRVETNHLTGNDLGIRADGAGNLIIRNHASGNGTNFSGIAGNTWGTIVPTSSSGAVSGNTGGGLGTTDPAANLVY